jgi:hypothetical protein
LVSSAAELRAIYAGSGGLVQAIREIGEHTKRQSGATDRLSQAQVGSTAALREQAVELGQVVSLSDSAFQSSLALAEIEPPVAATRLWSEELAIADKSVGALDIKLLELPARLPEAAAGFQALTHAIKQTKVAQTGLNAAVDSGISLQAEELARAVATATFKQGSAKSAALGVIRTKTMEAMAGYIASVLTGVPFPVNVALAAGAELVVGNFVKTALTGASKIRLPRFAQGGEFVTSGPQLILVGDNPSGREHVRITPAENRTFNQAQHFHINITAPLVDEAVVDSIGPAIVRARELGKIDVMVGSVDAH